MNWNYFLEKIDDPVPDVSTLKDLARRNFERFGVYPDSIHIHNGDYFFIARGAESKVLVAYGASVRDLGLQGDDFDAGTREVRVCPLNNENRDVMAGLFPYMNPVNHRGKETTIGLGDRLGLASPGHIRLLEKLDVFPVLAQQSMRELGLTGRTYKDVLSAASWAVFQEGYVKGFGADGDHLKTEQEIQLALDCGFTMITLDCSEHIDNTIGTLCDEEVDRKYAGLEAADREYFEDKYLKAPFILKGGLEISFLPQELKRIVLTYARAVRYAIRTYHAVIKGCRRPVDFEMSIDETLTPTHPKAHFFVASELMDGDVEITSLAPRFCGEFQKGIDYRGELERFQYEFDQHVRLADHFGYKISVHSGSDKFSVFPIIGKRTGGRYHLKTAGTNWLEAVRVIAGANPKLYRKIHHFALENLEQARKYYHIGADPARVPDIDTISDGELPVYLDMDDSRQIIHITYGLILHAKNENGARLFRDEIFETLYKNEDTYYALLQRHIGRHLNQLGIDSGK